MGGSGLLINVIDGDGVDTYLHKCRAMHPNHIRSHGVHSMVQSVTVATEGRKIALLRIFGHGHEGSQAVGGGRHPNHHQKFWIDKQGLTYNTTILQPLRELFAPNAIVQLHGCEVAEETVGLRLLRHLSFLWGAEVMAAFSKQKAHEGGEYNGVYISANGNRFYAYQLDADALTTP